MLMRNCSVSVKSIGAFICKTRAMPPNVPDEYRRRPTPTPASPTRSRKTRRLAAV